MSQKNDEVVYLNNCELVIQSVAFKNRGTYYLVWKKGKKSTQSNKFQITSDQPLNPKELLSLSLKVYHQSNVPLPRHTHLILFNGTGEEIERTKLMIHEWTGEFKQNTIQLSNAAIKIKFKRKGIMKLEKFHRLRSEVQETSQDEAGRFLKRASGKGSENERDEILRLTKELEDQNFLVDKLKQERNGGLIRIEKLEDELSKVSQRMRKDISKMRDYYSLKIDMRESVYKQEIQHLITSFNKNYELNYALLEGLIKQKYDYEHEIDQLKESNQDYISHQEANFERIITQMETHKKLVDQELHDSNEKLKEKEITITELNDQLDQINADLQNLRDAHKQLQEEKNREYIQFSRTIQEQNIKIVEYEEIIETDKLNVNNLTEELTHKEQDLNELNKMYEESLNEKTEMSKFNIELNTEKDHLQSENIMINNQLHKLRMEIEEQNNLMSKQRQNFEQNSNQLVKQLEKREFNFSQDLQILRNQNLTLHAKYEDSQNILELTKIQLQDTIQSQKSKDADIQILKHELQTEKSTYEHLLKENSDSLEHFKLVQAGYEEKIGVYINHNTQLEIDTTQLRAQLNENNSRNIDELDKLREEYERMTESTRKIYEDEMELLQTQKDDVTQQFEVMKGEYQSQIQSLMEQQKSELEQLQKLYKEEMENKTRDYVELLQRNSKVSEEFEEYKMKIEVEKFNEQNNKFKKKGKMPQKKKWNTSKITEEDEDEEDEPFQTVEVQSQQEDEEPLLKKKTKSKKKFKHQEYLIEEEEENQDQDQTEKGQSIVELFKQKHQPKSKLKKGKKLSQIVLQEDQQQEKPIEEPEEEHGQQIKISQSSQQAPKSASFEKIEIVSEQQQTVKPKLKKKTSKKSPSLSKKSNFDEEQFEELKAQKDQLTIKVNELEDQIANFKKNDKKNREKYEKEQKKYQHRVKALEDQIEELNQQIRDLNANFSSQDNKLQEAHKKQVDQRKKQAEQRRKYQAKVDLTVQIDSPKQSPSPKSVKKPKKLENKHFQKEKDKSEDQQKRKTPPKEAHQRKSPHKEFNEMKYIQKIEELQDLVSQKQRKVERLQKNYKELARQMEQSLVEGRERQNMLESKYMEIEKRQTRQFPQIISVEPSMKASLVNLQEKISLEREKYQELKLRYESKNREFEAQQTQLRKAKQRIEQLQERIKRQSIPKTVQELQSQIDDCNRKILELSRTINQARLQRDSFEDQIRILRKKMGDISKSNQEWESKAAEAERQVDDFKRKEQKYKREIDEWKDQQKRLKDNYRKAQDELVQVRKSQSEFVLQRKKVLDEIVRLQGVIAQKQTEIIKINKQSQKMKGKLSDDILGRTGKEKQFRTEFQKLQIQRSKSQRKNRELQQTIKFLKEKLEAAEKEAKKSLQERKQTYGQKLRKYIQEIMSVKKVVQQYQQQNSHLKNQNSQFFEQNEILKMSYEKIEIKYEELAQHEEQLQAQLRSLKQKASGLEQIIKKKAIEEEKANLLISTIRKELDNERVASRKKTQKLQSYEEINQRYLYEIKNLKVRLNDFETNADDVNKISEQFHASQRTIDSLQEQLHKISYEYEQHSTKYVYTRDDVQSAIRELKQHQDKIKEDELSRIIQELDQNHASNRQNMQNELLLLYSENERLRVNLQKTTQDALQFQLQLNQLEALKVNCRNLQKQKSILERRVAQLTDELKTAREQCRRLQVKFNQSIRNQQGKSTENVVLLQKYDELNRRYRELNQNYNELKVEDKRLLEKYKFASDEKDVNIEHLNSEIQSLNNKLLAYQLEIRRFKELQKFTNDDSFKKIKKLETRIEQMTQSHQQTSKQSEIKFKNQIKQLKNTIAKYEEQLSDKLHRIEELNEGVLMLQSQIEEITIELTNARAQGAEDGELYTIQINKLRNTMRQMEQAYDSNLRNLEEELSAMSKELTALKFSRETNNSRLRISRQSQGGDDKANRRFDEKMKLKDRRIEELKETILALQQKLHEKVRSENKGIQMESIKIKLVQIQRQHKEILDKKNMDLGKLNEELKRARQELFHFKSREEQLTLLLEQKEFQLQSFRSQLNMISKLYNDLQREVERRKENLNLQIKQQSILKIQIQNKNREIEAKNEQITQFELKYNDFDVNYKKKVNENKQLSQQVQELQRERNELLSVQRKKLEGQSLAKLKFKESEKELQSIKIDNRKLRNEINLVLKECDLLKSEVFQKTAAITDLLKQVHINDKKINDSQEIISKYITLNQKCQQQLKINLQDIVSVCLEMKESLELKQDELGRINEQLQQLKFMYQRKYLDTQELKRENCELILKVEERDFTSQQLESLQQKMEWLQQENKQLSFKEEAIKVQLQSLYSQSSENISDSQFRRRIADLLSDRYYM